MSNDRLASLRPDDPKRVGQYQLLARLGVGGMGRVYLGRSQGGRTVAVKMVHLSLAEDSRFRRRFALEVAAAERVGGFFTAQVVDADTDADPPWLVTEYIAGPSLQEAVDDQGPLPEPSVAALGAGLAEGLAAIHNQGVIHRDLKPGNVLLAVDGPRIIDFGIARALDVTSQTTRTSLVGTPGYMSPEQCRGDEVGPASDVFCLAAVLAFAATGRRPFGEGPGDALGYRIVNEDPDLSGVPPSLQPFIAAGLEKEPIDRPDVEEFLDRCSSLAGGQGLSLPTPVTTMISTRVAKTKALTGEPNDPKPKTAHIAAQDTEEGPSGKGVLIGVALTIVAALALISGIAMDVNSSRDSGTSAADTDYPTSSDGDYPMSDYPTSDYPTSDYTETEETSPTPDPTYEAFEEIGVGDCLDAYMDPYQVDEWSQDMPNAVDCDRTDAYMRVNGVESSLSDCESDYLDGEMWWSSSDSDGEETIYLCVERQLRVGECILGQVSDENPDNISVNNHGLMTSWGCGKDTVPQDFDYILEVTALNTTECPTDSYSWDYRGSNLCAEVV